MQKQLSKYTRTKLIMVNGKKQRAHRVIMEKHLGRNLLLTEDVHHLNHNPLDNRIENLQVIDRMEHSKLHALEKQKYPDFKNCVECRNEFKVNPRKRERHKCCSKECAQKIRVRAALQARGFNRSTSSLRDI